MRNGTEGAFRVLKIRGVRLGLGWFGVRKAVSVLFREEQSFSSKSEVSAGCGCGGGFWPCGSATGNGRK